MPALKATLHLQQGDKVWGAEGPSPFWQRLISPAVVLPSAGGGKTSVTRSKARLLRGVGTSGGKECPSK